MISGEPAVADCIFQKWLNDIYIPLVLLQCGLANPQPGAQGLSLGSELAAGTCSSSPLQGKS